MNVVVNVLVNEFLVPHCQFERRLPRIPLTRVVWAVPIDWWLPLRTAREFGPSSTVARMKMKTRSRSLAVAMTKMMVSILHHTINHRFSCFMTSSILSSWCPWTKVLKKVLHERSWEYEHARTYLSVATSGPCFGAPGLYKLASLIFWGAIMGFAASSGFGNPAGLPLWAGLQFSFTRNCGLIRCNIAPEFSHDSGSDRFSLWKIAIK